MLLFLLHAHQCEPGNEEAHRTLLFPVQTPCFFDLPQEAGVAGEAAISVEGRNISYHH